MSVFSENQKKQGRNRYLAVSPFALNRMEMLLANHLESVSFLGVFKGIPVVRKEYNSGGCAPPDLHQGLRPWTHSSRSCMVVITQVFRVFRWGYGKFGASGPRKPGKIRGGKYTFPSDYSPAFPGCLASGVASKGRRARSIAVPSLISTFLHAAAGTNLFFCSSRNIRCGSPEDEVLWRGV